MVAEVSDLSRLGPFLVQMAGYYNSPSFVETDPISVPRAFLPDGLMSTAKGIAYHPANVEIAGLIAAHFAWGRRDIAISKSWALLQRMDYEPVAFVRNASALEWGRLRGFVHRTFRDTDVMWMLGQWSVYLLEHGSLESMFAGPSVKEGLNRYALLMREGLATGDRLRKHFASPFQGSACKRMNMLLRWMVRSDKSGVDMGLWKVHAVMDLQLPLDVHVMATSKALGLLPAKEMPNWCAVEILGAAALSIFPKDPALLDFALFGLGQESLQSGNSVSEIFQSSRWSHCVGPIPGRVVPTRGPGN
jgi:uncharacterized protein (TIGR02757 family)